MIDHFSQVGPVKSVRCVVAQSFFHDNVEPCSTAETG